MNDCNIFAKASPPVCKKDLRGMVFGGGSLLALDAPPRLNNGKWEWKCQCLIHNVEPKYFRITKLESGAIKSCGCHGGNRYHINNDDLIGKQIGYIKVRKETRVNNKRSEFKVRCVVCGRERWVRAENLRRHIGISCRCIQTLKHHTIGKYYVLDTEGRKNGDGLPEMRCKKENGEEVWVLTEELLRTLAKEQLTKKMAPKQQKE